MKRFVISALAAWLLAAPAISPAAEEPEARAPVAPPVIQSKLRRLSLKEITGRTVLPLRSSLGSASIHFGSRGDELITRAALRLRYTYSPALIPKQSHIRVILNDETVGVIPLTREEAGGSVERALPIDPALFAGFNHLRLEFVAHYEAPCEDPLHTSLWADVSGSSELELTVQPLALRNDLALLPEPFFDQRDGGRLTLPFVFAARPSLPTLRAAGVVASWMGALASWRGASFPALSDRLPEGDALLFATNAERPAFLADHPPVEGPTLEMVTNPADGYSKLLLVLGRDGDDLLAAARALALGKAALSGGVMRVREFRQEAPRRPYDAPNWVRLDRPTKFGELVDSRGSLQVFGHVPAPIVVNLRVPPDLFTWHSRGVPVELKYRYPPPIRLSESRLTTSINDELVQSFNLRPSGEGGDSARMRLPLLDDFLFGENREIFLPAFKLGARNQLQFNFSFTYHKEGNCRDTQVENVRAMVDADSSVDFSGFPHYAELPNLNFFATAGYPFTRYADLSETVVVMPEAPTDAEIETLLGLLGRMGESTGYPATRFRLTASADESGLADADLLVIGALPRQGLLATWKDRLPADLSGGSRRIDQPARAATFLYDRLGFGTLPDPTVAAGARMEGEGPLAALLGFESPVSAGRSVVAVTATAPDGIGRVLDALDDPDLQRDIHGSVVFVHPDKVESLLVGKSYFVGYLPFWTTIWYWLATHPMLLALLAVLAVLFFTFAVWRTLRVIAERRIGGGP